MTPYEEGFDVGLKHHVIRSKVIFTRYFDANPYARGKIKENAKSCIQWHNGMHDARKKVIDSIKDKL